MKKLILVSLVSLLFVPLFAGASLDTNLSYGSHSSTDVKQLQEFLISKGFLTGSATGNFYSITLNAVKKYQKSIGVNQTGYVGSLTRQSINTELASNLSASNQEAVTETGTTPPAPEPQKTTNDVVSTLQAQIALLMQQLKVMQAQQTTTQQIQQNTQQITQNTQQIAQNTTPAPTPAPVCAPNWQCSTYSICKDSQQTRTCSDSNSCNTISAKPTLTQSCSMPVPAPICTLTAEWTKVPNSSGSNPYVPKISWTSQNALSGVIENRSNLGNPSEWHKCLDVSTVNSGSTNNACYLSVGSGIFVATFSGEGGKASCTATMTPKPGWSYTPSTIVLSDSSPNNPTSSLSGLSNGFLIAKITLKVNDGNQLKFYGFKYVQVISDELTKNDLTFSSDNGMPPFDQEANPTTVNVPPYSENTFNVILNSTNGKTGSFKLKIGGIGWQTDSVDWAGNPVGVIQNVSLETPLVTITP